MEFYFAGETLSARRADGRILPRPRRAGIAATVSTYYGAEKLEDEKSYIFMKGD